VRRVALYPRCRNLLRFGLWGGLAGVLLVSSPYLLNILTRGIDWITGPFPDFDNLWEVPLWLH
jgi:hypothetical protein